MYNIHATYTKACNIRVNNNYDTSNTCRECDHIDL